MERRGRFSDLMPVPNFRKGKGARLEIKTRAQPKMGIPILTAKILGVPLSEGFPLFRQVIQRENRGHRADGNTGSAINAFDRVDVQHFFFGECRGILLRMDTIHRACIHTSGVLSADARLCNYVCHKVSVSLRCLWNLTEPLILTRMPPVVQESAGFSTHRLTLAPHLAHTRQCAPPRRSPPRSADWPGTSAPAHCGPGNSGSGH